MYCIDYYMGMSMSMLRRENASMSISPQQELENITRLTSEEDSRGMIHPQPEAELVEQAQRNPEAFGQLYERFYGLINNYLYRRTLNIATAEELTSNTFFKALRALPKYKPQAPFCVWLYRIATNEIRMHRRSAWFRRVLRMDQAGENEIDRIYFTSPEAPDRIEREERMRQYAALHRALRNLPELYQAVLILRNYEGLKHEEIAQVLSKRTGTIKSLVSRGLQRMGRLMKKKHAT
jgi:RNA polymerase sigma-70 factor, ECF subfamily